MKYPDITLGRIEAVWNKLGGEEGVNRLLRNELEITQKTVFLYGAEDGGQNFITHTQKLTVNYDLTIADLLKAGKYGEVDKNITDQHFSSSEQGEKEAEFGIFYFNKDMTSKDVIAEMEKQGFRPASMKELLSYGIQNPEEQRKYPITSLGLVATLYNKKWFGCLGEDDDGQRYVGLVLGDGGPCSRFLAVRK